MINWLEDNFSEISAGNRLLKNDKIRLAKIAKKRSK
jgi:hypothetical protein